MPHYIDTHIHLDQLAAPGPMLDEAVKADIAAWVVPGVSPGCWPEVMATTELHAKVYVAPGVHPQAADRMEQRHLGELRRLLEHPRAVAVGEVGLDGQIEIPWQLQEKVFVEMIRLAREMEKPLLIHARRSTERILALLQQERADQIGGIFHAFSGSHETARKIIDMGFVLGIGGVMTFPSARRLPEVVRAVPADALVLETDAPDMTPAPCRGQPNRPVYLTLVADRLAELRGWSLAETARITTENSRRILRLA